MDHCTRLLTTPWADFNETYSPTIWSDAKLMSKEPTYLHGKFDKDVFMKQPEGFIVPRKENMVCKLNKIVYGLKQSRRLWTKLLLYHDYYPENTLKTS